MTQLGSNHFALFTRYNVRGYFECIKHKGRKDRLNSQLRKNVIAPGTSVIQVPNHCSFYVNGFILSAESLTVSEPSFARTVQPTFNDAVSLAHVSFEIKRGSISKLDTEKLGDFNADDFKIPEVDLEPIVVRQRRVGWEYWLSLLGLIVAGIVILTLVIWIMYMFALCVGCCGCPRVTNKLKRKNHAASPASNNNDSFSMRRYPQPSPGDGEMARDEGHYSNVSRNGKTTTAPPPPPPRPSLGRTPADDDTDDD